MNADVITSAQNAKVKHLLLLQQKAAARRAEKAFVVEGCREVRHCQRNGYTILSLFYCPSLLPRDIAIDALIEAVPSYALTEKVYERVAYRGSTEGIIAIVEEREQSLATLCLPANPLIVVLERVEKPGNIGAILRSADAAGVDAVFLCDEEGDLYNPNLIRSSLGAVFTMPCVCCTTAEAIAFLHKEEIQIITAQLQDAVDYTTVDMRVPTAIVMGTEATGLTTAWRNAAAAHVRIPMLGQLDSLNVSVSTAILLYEAVRQRHVR